MSKWNSSPHPISDIRDWSDAGRLELRPEFQRKEVWALPAKIMLIDSILRGVPLPKVYLSNEIRQDRTFRSVIDGQQRIAAILEFMRDGFALTPPYAGVHANKLFSQFVGDERNEILAYKIDFAEASNASDREIRDVYMRVNKYTVPLNKQELRRADYPGEFLTLVEDISVDESLENFGVFSATDRRRYADAEYVSEIIAALLDGPQDKKITLDDFYQRYATWPEADRTQVRDRFMAAVSDIQMIFASWPLGVRSTRFRQKADFYSLIVAIDSLRSVGGSIDGVDLTPLREDLRLLNDFIAPTSDVPILSEYAIMCVSQANSLSSRRWRTRLLEAVLAGTYITDADRPPALAAVFYRLREEIGTDGHYNPDAVVHCIICNSDVATGIDDCVLGWHRGERRKQIVNSNWVHIGAHGPGDWEILPRAAVSVLAVGAP